MAKILIIDDDVLITNLMNTLVTMDGHTAIVVNDSTRAVRVAKAENPDLITLDLMMPNLNGYEICELLRADSQFARTPIIIVSAKEDSKSKEMAYAAGATKFINKPFNIEDFLVAIKELTS